MKKLALVVVTVLIAQAGFAQVTIDPEAGVNFSNLRTVIGDNDANTQDATVGFSAGVGVNIPLSEALYLKPGIYYERLGSEVEEAGVTSTTHLQYLSVPVNLGYRLPIGNAGAFFAEAGPYIGYALDGDVTVESADKDDVTNDIEFGDGSDEINRLDWGFDFGVGYETPWGIYVKGSYGLGLGNLSNVSDVTTNNRNWNVGIGYRINI